MTRDEVLGIWARAPLALVVTARRRRLALVGAAAPGVLAAVLGTHLWNDPRLLGLGGAVLVCAVLARGLSEPRFRAWEAAASAQIHPVPSTQGPGHDP